METNKRIYLIDNLKGLLILLVVFGHFLDAFRQDNNLFTSIYTFIYAFHMPLFIFIFGLNFKKSKIKSNLFEFLILGYFLKVLMYIANIIRGKEVKFLFFSDAAIPWFLFVLAIYSFVAIYLNIHKISLVYIVLAIGISLITGYFDFIGNFFYLSRAIVFFPFYLLGLYISTRKTIIETLHLNRPIAFLIIISWLLFCLLSNYDSLYLTRMFLGRQAYLTSNSYSFLIRLLAYCISVLVSFSIVSVVSNKKSKFEIFGRKSFDIYFWHIFFIMLISEMLRKLNLTDNYIFLLVICLLASILVCRIISTLWIFNYPRKLIRGLNEFK